MKRVRYVVSLKQKKTASKSDTGREDFRRKSKRDAGYKINRTMERTCTDHV